MKIAKMKPVAKNKIGHIKLAGAHLEPHEYETMLFLNLYGYDIEVIKPSNTPKTKNPDFLINGAVWEAKSLKGSGSSTVARQIHKAGRQADRLILDLRRVKISANQAEHEVMQRSKLSTRIKHMMLISKEGKLFDIIK